MCAGRLLLGMELFDLLQGVSELENRSLGSRALGWSFTPQGDGTDRLALCMQVLDRSPASPMMVSLFDRLS